MADKITCLSLVRKVEGKKTFVSPMCKREDNIKSDIHMKGVSHFGLELKWFFTRHDGGVL